MFNGVIKRLFDLVFSFIMFLFLFPVNLATAFIILISSGRPIFFLQDRMGKFHRPFTVYKFRTMILHAEKLQHDGVSVNKLITREGNLLRKLHFDEFAQLLNVLKGDMSVVGPRPLSVGDYHRLFDNTEEYNVLDDYKPGITGLASLYNYANEKLRKKMLHSLGLDKSSMHDEHFMRHIHFAEYYHDNASFFLDVKILYWTGLLVLDKIFGR